MHSTTGGVQLISIHAPPRGATAQFDKVFQQIAISIHAPPRGATGYPARTAQAMIFQFTPLREGRRNLGFTGQNWFFISIHAPPRGATASRNATMRRGTFQFTPLREGRRSGRRLSRRKTPISIHAPPRGATYLLGNGVELENISIHAPPRGATSPRCPKRRASRNFNSRPSARGDAKRDGEKKEHIVFQFTPLREGRHKGGMLAL